MLRVDELHGEWTITGLAFPNLGNVVAWSSLMVARIARKRHTTGKTSMLSLLSLTKSLSVQSMCLSSCRTQVLFDARREHPSFKIEKPNKKIIINCHLIFVLTLAS